MKMRIVRMQKSIKMFAEEVERVMCGTNYMEVRNKKCVNIAKGCNLF